MADKEPEPAVEIVYTRNALDRARALLNLTDADVERLEEEEGAKAQDRAQAGRLGLGAKFVSHNNATMSIVAGVERKLQNKLRNAKERHLAKDYETGSGRGGEPSASNKPADTNTNKKRRVVDLHASKPSKRHANDSHAVAEDEEESEEEEDLRKLGKGAGAGKSKALPPVKGAQSNHHKQPAGSAVLNPRHALLGLQHTTVQHKPQHELGEDKPKETKAEKRKRKKLEKKQRAAAGEAGPGDDHEDSD